ncbi:MAG: DUF1996 domain-containing protein [Sphingomicrobium sp.]|nr:DUF1996 domain-containing protein [Sphingomonadales bacterium]
MTSDSTLGLKGIMILIAAVTVGVAGTQSEPGGRFDRLTRIVRKAPSTTTTTTPTTFASASTSTTTTNSTTTSSSNGVYPELTAVTSNFDINTDLGGSWGNGAIPASNAPDNVGAFRFICSAGQVLRDDPIVYPGHAGASHLHQFFGNMTANANSTYASLRSAGGSSCEGFGTTALNRSAYWMPAMLDGKGNVVRPDYVAIYYKRRPISDPKCSLASGSQAEGDCLPLPNGLRYIAGYDMVTNTAKTGSAYFNCDGATAQSAHYDTLTEAAAHCPTAPNPDGSHNRIGAVINMPMCWDGRNLDSPNHRSHMAYGNYDGGDGVWRCPLTHPKLLPAFTMGVWYTVDANLGTWHLASDEMHPELAPGSTFHADWFGAWDNTVEAMWMDGCINHLLNCSGGDLGNGKQIKNAWGTSWFASPRLVPVP